MISNPYQKYQQSSVQTASPEQLILMLYDGAIRFTRTSIEAIEQHDFTKANQNLQKAQRIINELIASLDFQFEVSNKLMSIYEYMLHQLIQANIQKQKAPASEVLAHLIDLKETWSRAMLMQKAGTANNANG
ncbi:flagellar export chaperone FliS [Paenibacillus pinisoli]|uniref:Flagellar secretion chaperone FliS n=1 Tax=Paenibacillus pinisoli TaxID=1276110 RepID=A0A3A6PE18_9BACL|nr:flagellar export chaperone FliS [Paenibacillus pinisoli]RJX36948.1 flagellar export chaperone FliS [Paenibacillus pinisoli]